MRVHGKREVFPIINGMDISDARRHAARARARRQRLGADLDGRGVRPAAPEVTWGATVIGRVDATLEGPVEITYSDDAPSPGDLLIGTQVTEQMLPWAFMAGANVDVTPNVEVGAELRYWLYRQYKKQHTDVVGIFLVRELETMKNYSDSWADLRRACACTICARAPGLELMAGVALRQVAGAGADRHARPADVLAPRAAQRRCATRSGATGSARATSTTGT